MLSQIHAKIVSTFSRHGKGSVVVFSLSVLCLLCWLDYVTGDYSLIIFYLLPVSFTAWFIGRNTGILFCVLSLLARIIADYVSSPLTGRSSLHYWNLSIEFSFLLIMSMLFSVLKNKLDGETALARIDPLTKAINRRSFFMLAELELSRAKRYNHPLTVAYIDLDNFKIINDKWGHSTGDKLLVAVVDTINFNIRNSDILARLGGDEFILLLPETTGDSAHTTLEKVHRALMQTMRHNSWPVTYSIGAISYQVPPATIEEAIRAADTLMYNVKRSGKDRLLHISSE